MTIYINRTWTSRSYECTNVRFQVTDGAPRDLSTGRIDLENWVALSSHEQDEAADYAELGSNYLAEVYNVEPIGGFEGHCFFGHM